MQTFDKLVVCCWKRPRHENRCHNCYDGLRCVLACCLKRSVRSRGWIDSADSASILRPYTHTNPPGTTIMVTPNNIRAMSRTTLTTWTRTRTATKPLLECLYGLRLWLLPLLNPRLTPQIAPPIAVILQSRLIFSHYLLSKIIWRLRFEINFGQQRAPSCDGNHHDFLKL